MVQTVSSLPPRPLSKREVLGMEDAREYCIDPTAEEAYIIMLFGQSQAHALSYDADAEGWVQFESEQIENSDEASIDTFEDSIYEWADEKYGDRIGDDLKMAGPDDPPADPDDEDEREVEMGLEAEFDRPDCDYYKTSMTTAPQSFLDHLEEEHGYSRGEANEILNG